MLTMQRTPLLNGLRGHLVVIGVIALQRHKNAHDLVKLVEATDPISILSGIMHVAALGPIAPPAA